MTKLLSGVAASLLAIGLFNSASFAASPKPMMKPAKKMAAASCPF